LQHQKRRDVYKHSVLELQFYLLYSLQKALRRCKSEFRW